MQTSFNKKTQKHVTVDVIKPLEIRFLTTDFPKKM